MKTPDGDGSPLFERYASAEMLRLFSRQRKFETWRLLWLWLAEEERRLGLPISEEAVTEMRAHLSDVDFEAAGREEQKTRHDVMAHVRVFGEAAPARNRRCGPPARWSGMRTRSATPSRTGRTDRPGCRGRQARGRDRRA